MNREEIEKVIKSFAEWYDYQDTDERRDWLDRTDYVVYSFLDSEQAEELLQEYKTITDEEIEKIRKEAFGEGHRYAWSERVIDKPTNWLNLYNHWREQLNK